jgi:hypothetical protein
MQTGQLQQEMVRQLVGCTMLAEGAADGVN